MKTRWIVLLVVGAVIIIAAVVVGIFFPRTPETVSVAEYQGFQSEVTGRLDTAEAEIIGISQTLDRELPKIQQGFMDITGQIEGLGETLEGLNEQKAIGEMTAKQAALEKEIVELKEGEKDTSQQSSPQLVYVLPYPSSQPDSRSSHYRDYCRTESFTSSLNSVWFDESDNYKFEVKTDNEFRLYVDGQLVLNKQAANYEKTYSVTLYLAQGCHDIKLEYPRWEEEPVFGWRQY